MLVTYLRQYVELSRFGCPSMGHKLSYSQQYIMHNFFHGIHQKIMNRVSLSDTIETYTLYRDTTILRYTFNILQEE